MNKIAAFCITILALTGIFSSISCASLTKEQSEDVAAFAVAFIEKGNERRDESGYPLLVYALSSNANTCVEIRRSGYNSELYYVRNNNYHMRNGSYLELGYKWCMDCGDFISYVYHTTLGLDLLLHSNEDPWHIKDMYADANQYENSQYFEFVYKNVPISAIDESKLEKGDVILRMGSTENHGLIYVGEGMQAAHASRNGIKYSNNPLILGFEVVQFNRFYKTSTVVSIVRVKDGVVPEDKMVHSVVVWPDTGEEEDLLSKPEATPLLAFTEEGNTLEIEVLHSEAELENIDFTDLVEVAESKNVLVKDNVLYWISEEIKRLLIKLNENKEIAVGAA
ncbi:MAG: C40 family peptidase [Clostridia bacterium]|nr:C40 family peptidase [Clostridia bacterium]